MAEPPHRRRNKTPKGPSGEAVRPAAADWPARFLAALRDLGSVRHAAKAAGVGRRTAYDRRAADPTFAAAWGDALADAEDELHAEARRRAMGVKVGDRLLYSDTLLMFLLKAANPAKYRDNYRVVHTGPAGGPIRVEAPAVDVHQRIRELTVQFTAEQIDARPDELARGGGGGVSAAHPG